MEPIGYDAHRSSEILDEMGIDVLVTASDVNVFYTTGLPTLRVAPNPILWVLRNQFPYLGVMRRDGELSLIHWLVYNSVKKFSWVADTRGIMSPQQALQELAEIINEWGMADKTIGLERAMPSYQSEFLRAQFPGATFTEADPVLLKMRLIKSTEELRRLQESTDIAEAAIQAMMDATQEEITDNQLLHVARRSIVDAGADGWDHLTLGIGASDPEAPGIGTTVQVGDLCRFDIGAVYQGYVSDISRHVVLGNAPEGIEEVINRLITTQDFCIEQIRPDVMPKEVLKAAKEFYKTMKKGMSPAITCHSIGLECEEIHLFSPMGGVEFPFEENMVMDIEIWQPFKNVGLVGVEDTFRVTATGCDQVNHLEKQIVVK